MHILYRQRMEGGARNVRRQNRGVDIRRQVGKGGLVRADIAHFL